MAVTIESTSICPSSISATACSNSRPNRNDPLQIYFPGHDCVRRDRDQTTRQITDLHDRTAAANIHYSRGQARSCTGNLEGDIERASGGKLFQRIAAVGNIDDVIGTETLRKRKWSGSYVDDGNFRHPCQARREQRQEPDRTGAEDDPRRPATAPARLTAWRQTASGSASAAATRRRWAKPSRIARARHRSTWRSRLAYEASWRPNP